VKLQSWTDTTNLFLHCKEELYTLRDWSRYQVVHGEAVCKPNSVSWTQVGECQTPCKYDATIDKKSSVLVKTELHCTVEDEHHDTIQEWIDAADSAELRAAFGVYPLGSGESACDCPCEDIVHVEEPPFAVLCLAFFSQNCMACIVGVTLGFRTANINVWRNSARKNRKIRRLVPDAILKDPTGQSAATSKNVVQVWNSKAYDENSQVSTVSSARKSYAPTP